MSTPDFLEENIEEQTECVAKFQDLVQRGIAPSELFTVRNNAHELKH